MPMETEGAAAPLLFLIYFSESSFPPSTQTPRGEATSEGNGFPRAPVSAEPASAPLPSPSASSSHAGRNVFSLSAFHEPQPVVEVEAAAPTPPVPPRDSFAPSTASV